METYGRLAAHTSTLQQCELGPQQNDAIVTLRHSLIVANLPMMMVAKRKSLIWQISPRSITRWFDIVSQLGRMAAAWYSDVPVR